jgi:hypothetical protein
MVDGTHPINLPESLRPDSTVSDHTSCRPAELQSFPSMAGPAPDRALIERLCDSAVLLILYLSANKIVRATMCRDMHPDTRPAECPLYVYALENDVRTADPHSGPDLCAHLRLEHNARVVRPVHDEMTQAQAKAEAADARVLRLSMFLAARQFYGVNSFRTREA